MVLYGLRSAAGAAGAWLRKHDPSYTDIVSENGNERSRVHDGLI